MYTDAKETRLEWSCLNKNQCVIKKCLKTLYLLRYLFVYFTIYKYLSFFYSKCIYQLSYTYVHKWLKIFPPQNEEEEKLHPVLEGGGGSLAPLFSSPMMVSEVKKRSTHFYHWGFLYIWKHLVIVSYWQLFFFKQKTQLIVNFFGSDFKHTSLVMEL